MLSQHHDVLQKLREEILSTVGESRRPTIEDMKAMKYLRAVINETLRLYPAVCVTIFLALTLNTVQIRLQAREYKEHHKTCYPSRKEWLPALLYSCRQQVWLPFDCQ